MSNKKPAGLTEARCCGNCHYRINVHRGFASCRYVKPWASVLTTNICDNFTIESDDVGIEISQRLYREVMEQSASFYKEANDVSRVHGIFQRNGIKPTRENFNAWADLIHISFEERLKNILSTPEP